MKVEVGQIRVWTGKAEGTSIGGRIKIEVIEYSKMGEKIVGYSYPITRKDGHIFKRAERFILRHSSLLSPVLGELF